MMYSNIPTIIAQQDFNNSHADMLASARGEVFIGWDLGNKDKTHYWFNDVGPVEENVFYRMWAWSTAKVDIKPEWCIF